MNGENTDGMIDKQVGRQAYQPTFMNSDINQMNEMRLAVKSCKSKDE